MPDNTLRKTELTGFMTVSITGADRIDFLQGQLTKDLRRVTADFSPLTGWATAKGRLLAVSPLIAWRDGIHMVLPEDIGEQVAQRLRMFVLRARAEIQTGEFTVLGLTGEPEREVDVGDIKLRVAAGATAATGGYCAARCNGDLSRAWLIGEPSEIASLGQTIDKDFATANEWTLADIRAGIPCIASGTSEAFVPQMVNLDLLDAISFEKGCYVGQEIVARTQNLGRIKRRMYRFSAASEGPLVPGQLVHAATGATGKVVSSVEIENGAELLAVVPIADVDKQWFADEAHERPLQLESLPYTV